MSKMKHQNHIPFDGDTNFRDLGGYIGHNKRPIVYRKLFRSGDLSRHTPADHERLLNLGIQHVIDLRTDVERTQKPNILPPGLTHHHHPLLANLGAASLDDLFAQILQGNILAEDYMLQIYRTVDPFKISQWTQIFQILAKGEATLWHCTAGKDRTGMTAALVLTALGVDNETIMADYLLTNTYSHSHNESIIQHLTSKYGSDSASKIRDLFIVKPAYLQAFWDTLHTQYGSVQEFLSLLKIDSDALRRLYLGFLPLSHE